jgi:hypothetical protein
MQRTKPKPVYRIDRNPVDDPRFPFALFDATVIVQVAATPFQLSNYAFITFGEGIEVRHDYLTGSPA